MAFEPGFLYPAPLPNNNSFFNNESQCADAGGSVVRVLGVGADGTPSHDALVTLWLSPANSAKLAPIGNPAGDPSKPLVVKLSSDDATAGSATACVLPGATVGTITVNGRSGIITAQQSIDVRALWVPPGGSLALAVEPGTTASQTTTTPSSCAMGSTQCIPGQGRQAAVSIVAQPPASGPPIPAGAAVIVTTNLGWLVASGKCDPSNRSNRLSLTLDNQVASVTWCIGDAGGTGTITAVSGMASDSKMLISPAVPVNLMLITGGADVAKGAEVKLEVLVIDCEGRGVPNVLVAFSATMGQLRFATNEALATTGADGRASVTATAGAGPIAVLADVAVAPSVSCTRSIQIVSGDGGAP